MNTKLNTPITTAARRIQRTISQTPAALRVWFDADGQEVTCHEADMRSMDPSVYEGAVVSLRGGAITQRQAQDALDWVREPEEVKGMTSAEGYMWDKAHERALREEN